MDQIIKMRLLYTLLAIFTMGVASAQYYVIPNQADAGEVFTVTGVTQNSNGGFSFDLNDEGFVTLDEGVMGMLSDTTIASPETFSAPLTVTIPSSVFSDNQYFEYPCNPTSGNNIVPNGTDCGGGRSINPLTYSMLFTFDDAGVYNFDWGIDGDDERTSKIVVHNNETIVVHLTSSVRVVAPRTSALTGPAPVTVVVSDTFESYIVAHDLFEGTPHQTRFETGTPGVFTVQVANNLFSGAGNEWEALLVEPAGRRIEIQIPSYGVTMLGNFRSAINGDSFDSISMNIPAVYTDNSVILSLLQQLEPGVAGVGNTDNPRIILRME